jgi:hypothetical protein
MAISVAICGLILGWYVRRGAPVIAYVAVAVIAAFLIVYNVARVVRARSALREPAFLESFAAAQRRSHRLRGRIYLVGAPILIGATWFGAFTSLMHPESWVVLLAITLFLSGGWWWWFRAIRRVA